MKPMLFNERGVIAFQNNLKTQTRRPIKGFKDLEYSPSRDLFCWYSGEKDNAGIDIIDMASMDEFIKQFCKYQVGDIVYIQEPWRVGGWTEKYQFAIDHSCEPYDTSWHTPEDMYDGDVLYDEIMDELKALDIKSNDGTYSWEKFKSPLAFRDAKTMPEWVARHHYKIKNIRFKLLQDISEEDCISEGLVTSCEVPEDVLKILPFGDSLTIQEAYKEYIWDKLPYEAPYKWEDNPYVFVYEFERVEKPNDNNR